MVGNVTRHFSPTPIPYYRIMLEKPSINRRMDSRAMIIVEKPSISRGIGDRAPIVPEKPSINRRMRGRAAIVLEKPRIIPRWTVDADYTWNIASTINRRSRKLL